uniref:Uncharacterized protein n=1 Tax=Oryza meridionalis TaxID=40149 RepID=A0A0E0CF16_9ORYZ
MDIDGQPGQVQQGHGRGHSRGSGSHSTIEPTNIASAGRGCGNPLSLNDMPGGRSIIGKIFLTKRSASTCSPHPSPSTHEDDAPVESIAEEVLEEPIASLEILWSKIHKNNQN